MPCDELKGTPSNNLPEGIEAGIVFTLSEKKVNRFSFDNWPSSKIPQKSVDEFDLFVKWDNTWLSKEVGMPFCC